MYLNAKSNLSSIAAILIIQLLYVLQSTSHLKGQLLWESLWCVKPRKHDNCTTYCKYNCICLSFQSLFNTSSGVPSPPEVLYDNINSSNKCCKSQINSPFPWMQRMPI